MKRRLYMLSFEPLDEDGEKQLREAIKLADAWWHHLSGTWLILDTLGLEFWHDLIFPIFDAKKKKYLLVEVETPTRANGRLPKKAWEWIRTHVKS